MTRYITLEGCHGTGSSTHADTLTESLRFLGIDAVSWHHPAHPDGAVGESRVAHYVEARRALWAMPNAVVVMDRGPWSGIVHARSVQDAGASWLASGVGLASMECATFGSNCAVALLTAPDDVLDGRLTKRGEDPAEFYDERVQWLALAASEGWPIVDTSGDVIVVAQRILRWALGVLG